jgi:DNA-binding transcriptional MerR regulator
VEGGYSASQAAKMSGFSIDTLRYYERIGLLDGIERTPSGHRRFRDEDLEWLGVLRCPRDTGMPIAQMQKYAELSCGGQATLAERMSLLTEHDTRVKERIALLQAQHGYLQDKIAWYRTQIATAVPDEAMSTAPGAGTSEPPETVLIYTSTGDERSAQTNAWCETRIPDKVGGPTSGSRVFREALGDYRQEDITKDTIINSFLASYQRHVLGSEPNW